MELQTTACVIGGGPAGLMAGLLLARNGVEVIVLEKHKDFLRDFRGDTVHPSTQEVLDELGLAEEFAELPYERVRKAETMVGGQLVTLADFSRLRTKFPYIAMVPQWDFLDMLAGAAERLPNFRLLRRAEAVDLLREGDRITGVRVQQPDGPLEVRAALTIAADGRTSMARQAAGLRVREFGSAMDVLWFRLSRTTNETAASLEMKLGPGRAYIVIPRDTYWQIAQMIAKGGYEELKQAGIAKLRTDFQETVPELGDRAGEVRDWTHVSMLEVRINRLRRWYTGGLLCIGDAAHAMSPVGGIGINLAVQDAVAAANLLTDALLAHQRDGTPVPTSALAAVQRRRGWPAVVTQAFQRLVQRFGVERTLRQGPGSTQPAAPPVPAGGIPVVRRVVSRLIGIGVRPEHVRPYK
jgi:2-polyprenyl-6-methoxyphenol hydroxylase-like FAD-dependent oxidoreductase